MLNRTIVIMYLVAVILFSLIAWALQGVEVIPSGKVYFAYSLLFAMLVFFFIHQLISRAGPPFLSRDDSDEFLPIQDDDSTFEENWMLNGGHGGPS